MDHKEKKEAIKSWIKNPSNLILIGILLLAFIVRVYFFIETKGQTLWYDEADYMSTSKGWAYDVWYNYNAHRPPLFMGLAAIIFNLGLGESFIRFFLVILPSVLLVYCTYLLGTELYNKKTGLIAAFFMSVSWSILFWTARVQPDFLSVSFSILSFLFIWRYWKTKVSKFAIYAGIFAALGFHFKVSGLLVPMTIALFILFKDRFEAFNNKDYYYFAAAFIATLLPYLIWAKIKLGTFLAFSGGYSSAVENQTPFAFWTLSFFRILLDNFTFILFILGVIIALRFLLYTDLLVKDKNKVLNADLFSILAIIVTWAFYIFYIRSMEDRWVFIALPFIYFIIANFVLFVYDKIVVSNKQIATWVVIIVVLVSGYIQLSNGNTMIDSKEDSYLPVQQAALWVKQNSNPQDVVMTISYPQTYYYTDGKALRIPEEVITKEQLNAYIGVNKPRYIEISVFENHPAFVHEWINENQQGLTPVHIYYGDAQRTQPILVVYEVNYA